MKKIFFSLLIGLICISGYSGEIQLTQKTNVTITNVQGRVMFTGVNLIRADQTGLVWMKDATGGKVLYTQVSPDQLLKLGIPTNLVRFANQYVTAEKESKARYLNNLNTSYHIISEQRRTEHEKNHSGLLRPKRGRTHEGGSSGRGTGSGTKTCHSDVVT